MTVMSSGVRSVAWSVSLVAVGPDDPERDGLTGPIAQDEARVAEPVEALALEGHDMVAGDEPGCGRRAVRLDLLIVSVQVG